MCTALGFPVPTPFFLQQLLNGPYIDNDIVENVTHRGRFTAIILGAELLPEERMFCDKVTAGFGNWWTREDATLPTFDQLSAAFMNMMTKVSERLNALSYA